jgi:hypothetical protein
MQRVTVLAALGLLLFAGYANAQDCSRVGAPCSDQKYGMGNLPDFRRNTVPPDFFDGGPATITAPFNHDDFGPDFGGVSYGYSRADEANQVGPKCGRERGFLPLPGQIILREQDGCVPTSEGPTGEGGCRVEIPVTDGGKDDPATVIRSRRRGLPGRERPAHAQHGYALHPARGSRRGRHGGGRHLYSLG